MTLCDNLYCLPDQQIDVYVTTAYDIDETLGKALDIYQTQLFDETYSPFGVIVAVDSKGVRAEFQLLTYSRCIQ